MGEDGVLRGRDMLCFGHDFTGDPLSKTHLMRLLARENRVLWINSIGYRAPTASKSDLSRIVNKLQRATEPVKEVEPNIFVLNPLAIPVFGVPAMQIVNRQLLRYQVLRAMAKLGFQRPINWVFNPSAGVVAGALGEERLIYYCVDEFTAFEGLPPQMVEIEDDLCRRADLVVVSAQRLYDRKIKKNPRTVLVRHGVDFEHFRKALDPATEVPPEIANLPRPVLGYFGLMAADWIDLDLLVAVAKHFSTGSLVLLGKVTTDLSRLTALPNVHLLGRKPFGTLPAYSKGFDVGLNPFPINEVTLNSNPLKVREYLAAGLPVVSTRIPEVEVLPQCQIGDTPAQYIAEIEKALTRPGPRAERSETMRSESWPARLEELRRHFVGLGTGRLPAARQWSRH
ncbi:MAG TPA: glycosyltransferase [Polyangia bacterium]|nr:glycosyltransferase [Polyangia bacterium]